MAAKAPSGSSNITAVQATNDDAAASKLSCVKKGYMNDPFVHLFVRRPVRRSPIISRGYYARWAVLRRLLAQFLASGEDRKQVLSLGAGFDTTFFQLSEEGAAPHLYVELDFAEVTSKKATLVEHRIMLKNIVGEEACISKEKGEILSDHYKLLPGDLHDNPTG